MISAPLRRCKRDKLLTNHRLPIRQWFAAFSGGGWEYKIDGVATFRLPFLVMFCVFLDTSFAHWYFQIILEEHFFHFGGKVANSMLASDFGPDIMWCGAATDWLEYQKSDRVPCMLSSIVIEHLDERQIQHQSIDVTSHNYRRQRMTAMEQAPLKVYSRNLKSGSSSPNNSENT